MARGSGEREGEEVIVLRALGGALLLLALLVLGHDLYRILGEGAQGLSALGELWYGISPGSLNLSQAVIQRYVAPELWDEGVLPLLLWPAAAVIGVPGLLLLALGSLGRRPQRRRRH
jgi:hypothetical protein